MLRLRQTYDEPRSEPLSCLSRDTHTPSSIDTLVAATHVLSPTHPTLHCFATDMIVLAPLFLASLALADTVLIHPGDEDLCIRADAPREREQLSQYVSYLSHGGADNKRTLFDERRRRPQMGH